VFRWRLRSALAGIGKRWGKKNKEHENKEHENKEHENKEHENKEHENKEHENKEHENTRTREPRTREHENGHEAPGSDLLPRLRPRREARLPVEQERYPSGVGEGRTHEALVIGHW
jgi:Sec-independent protein translocase protein TatA